MHPRLWQEIAVWKEAWREARGREPEKGDLVFPNARDPAKHMTRQAVDKALRTACSEQEVVGASTNSLRRSALKKMEKSLDESIDRLERLKRLGHPIREVEIKSAQDEKEALKRHLSKSRLRLDSIRLSAIGA